MCDETGLTIVRPKTITFRKGLFCDLLNTTISFRHQRLCFFAVAIKESASWQGSMAENVPSAESSIDTDAASSSGGRVSAWRAILRFSDGLFSERRK